jgi:N utilization substance protein B
MKGGSRASSDKATRERSTSEGRAPASRPGASAAGDLQRSRQGGSRRRAREFALQGLYQRLLARTDPAIIRAQLAESRGFGRCDVGFFDELWHGVTSEFDTLIAAVRPYLDRVPEQLSPIEKGVLAIGAWELLRSPDVPYRVAINEAVELAKTYGGSDGHKYVNGVLDKLAAETRAVEFGARRAAT